MNVTWPEYMCICQMVEENQRTAEETWITFNIYLEMEKRLLMRRVLFSHHFICLILKWFSWPETQKLRYVCVPWYNCSEKYTSCLQEWSLLPRNVDINSGAR